MRDLSILGRLIFSILLMSSPDGVNWKEVDSFVNLTTLSFSKELNQFLMTTTEGFYISKELGTQWTAIPISSEFENLNPPVYGNGVFVFTANYGEDDGGDETSWAYIYTSGEAPWDE